METFAYIAVAIVLIPIAWWLVKVALGFTVPLETTARAYLGQVLKRMGLFQFVPPGCVDECANDAVAFARNSAKYFGKNLRTETVEQLELHADMLRLWVRSDDPFSDRHKEHYRAIFQKYSLPRNKS